MPTSSRAPSAVTIALLAFGFIGAATVPVATASATAATEVAQESVGVFEDQLSGHRVRGATLHTKAHRLHVTLKDGRKVTVSFPASEQQRLLADARAHGVTIKIAKTQQPSHKRRDIAIAVAVVVVIVIAIAVGIWLLARRRRIREEHYGPQAG